MAESKIKEWLRQLKLSYTAYNFFHQHQLAHNKAPYQSYGVLKPIYKSISSIDFEKMPPGEIPWLDTTQGISQLHEKLKNENFTTEIKEQITNWPKNGYLILKSFFNAEEIQGINSEIERIVDNKILSFYPSNKIMFANKHSAPIQKITKNESLHSILSFILGKKVIPFQTINFLNGSEQKAHSDSIHMTTYPLGFLIAAWIALEDVELDQGPLSYYPGSHSLPYLLNKDYERGGNKLTVGAENNYWNYEAKIESVVDENLKKGAFKKEIFSAKKGDVLIWHANLIHGGEPIIRKGSTRKSMVIHFFGDNVIKYHEITERPALLDL